MFKLSGTVLFILYHFWKEKKKGRPNEEGNSKSKWVGDASVQVPDISINFN